MQQHHTQTAQQLADMMAHYTQEGVSQGDANTDEILHVLQGIQAQGGTGLNHLNRGQHQLAELIATIHTGQQAIAAGLAHQSAGFDATVQQLANHIGHMTASVQNASLGFMNMLTHLRETQQQAPPQQIIQIMQQFNVPHTYQHLAIAYVRGDIDANQAYQLSLQDGSPQDVSPPSSFSGPAAPPVQQRAPLQDMSVGGASEQEVRESTGPLIRMNAEMQPENHDIRDIGNIATQMEVERTKVMPARRRQRMPLKYHEDVAHIAAKVMKGQLRPEDAKSVLQQLKAKRYRKKLADAATEPVNTKNPNLQKKAKILKTIVKKKKKPVRNQEPEEEPA
jgi:hypothetical protein